MPNRKLWDVLIEGTGDTRTQPLIFARTTAEYDRNSICWEVHEDARKVKEGIYEKPYFLPAIYGLPEEEDWENEDAVNGIIYAEFPKTETNIAGNWIFWAFITFSDGKGASGETITRYFYLEGS